MAGRLTANTFLCDGLGAFPLLDRAAFFDDQNLFLTFFLDHLDGGKNSGRACTHDDNIILHTKHLLNSDSKKQPTSFIVPNAAKLIFFAMLR